MAKKSTRATGGIAEFVMAHPLFGAHSHISHVPEWAQTPRHFSAINGYAGADLTTAAGPLGIGKTELPPTSDRNYAKRYFELWRASRFTGYCRAAELACRDLLGLEYVEKNADAINKAIGKIIGDDPRKSYCDILQKKANMRWLIKDSVQTPEETVEEKYPSAFVRFNYRNEQVLGTRSREDICHWERSWNRAIHCVNDLVDGFNESISRCLATGKVTCFKMGLPYYRSLAITEPTLHEAEQAFSRIMNVVPGGTHDGGGVRNMPRVSAKDTRPLQDYLIHQYVRRIEAEGVPLQVHTGYLAGNWGVLNDVRTMDMVPFMLRYPRVRFDLFHAGWPYTEEHAVIGKELPNTWLNLCWMWTMNPATAERALDSWLASVPHTKILGYGGDCGSPISEYGYAQQARIGIARVLQRWIDRGDMTLADAKEVAADIMLMNGCRLHGLEP